MTCPCIGMTRCPALLPLSFTPAPWDHARPVTGSGSRLEVMSGFQAGSSERGERALCVFLGGGSFFNGKKTRLLILTPGCKIELSG